MRRIWQVALHEYKRHVFNKRFLLGIFSVPLVIVLMVGLIFLVISMENDARPLGYVDYSGLLRDPLPAPKPEPPDRPVAMQPFATETAARSSLEAGEIQAYYVLPDDYRSSGKLTVVHMGKVKASARQQFYDFLAVNLLRDTDPQVASRLTEGSELVTQSPDGSRSASSENWISVFVPMIAGLALLISMFTTGGYLMQAVVEEKENRTMEVIVTSVSPDQFMAGKIIGDIAVGMTQIILWSLFIIVSVLIGRNYMDFLRGIQILPQTVLLLVFIILPSFVMVAALMAAIGATVTEAREGQQVVGILSLPIWIPYMLLGVLINNPNSPIAVGLSMVPLTASLAMLFRDGMTILPAWQIALSAFIQIASAAGAIWLAGRAFRLGMLRYGKRVAWRELFARQGGRP
jgi:ABC-2 type transport system permease protein